MVKITLAIKKGGEGKSTTSINFGTYLAINGNRVLVIDLDDQANTTSVLLGKESPVCFEDLVRKRIKATDIILPSIIDKLDIVPSNRNLVYMESPLLKGEAGGSYALRDFFQDNELESKYDYCIIDTPRSLSIITELALVAADFVLIPVSPAKFSVDGLVEMKKKIESMKESHNHNLQFLGAFLNRYIAHRNYIKAIELDLQEFYKDKFLRSKVRLTSSIEEASLKGLPIFLYSMTCAGALDFRSLFEEILETITSPALIGG